MMFSWEKQKTPSRPPLMLVSITTPESATMSIPSNSFTLRHREGISESSSRTRPTRPPTLWDKVWTVRVWCVKLIFSMGRRHVFDWYRELPRPHTHFLSISSVLTLVQRSITSNIWTRWHDVRKYQENTSYPIKPPEFRKPESWTVGERAQRERERHTVSLSLWKDFLLLLLFHFCLFFHSSWPTEQFESGLLNLHKHQTPLLINNRLIN